MAHILSYRATDALWNVFVRPAISAQRCKPPGCFQHTASKTPWRGHRPHLLRPLHRRSFSNTPYRRAPGPPPSKPAPLRRSQKWDDEITSFRIILVDPATNTLLPPQSRDNVLHSIDRTTHRLVQLDMDPTTHLPICKILSKKEMFDHEKQRRLASKERKAETRKVSSVKTLELNWAIDGNDLAHRLERVEEFLAEGRRVEIILAPKKRGRRATSEECMRVLEKIKAVLGKVKGAKEFKAFQGKMGGFATWILQGKTTGREENEETKVKSTVRVEGNGKMVKAAEIKHEGAG